jgi:hypothetical protein
MKMFGCKCRLECLLVALVLGFLMGAHILGSSLTREGFAALGYSMDKGVHSDTYKKKDSIFEKVLEPTVPLAEGSLFMFAQNKQTSDCCKDSTWSGSSGCVCPTTEQINFLSSRGGNKSEASPY